MTKRVRQAELGLFATVDAVSVQTGHDIKMVRSDVKRDFRATFMLSFNGEPVADGLIFSEVQAVLTVLGNIFGDLAETSTDEPEPLDITEEVALDPSNDVYENEAVNVI